MAPKFGTSGLRGLVAALTDDLVSQYTCAFLSACDSGEALCIGRDLRPSSPRIAQAVIHAARQRGHKVIDCGPLPTPALALAAQEAGCGAAMVTGSHIPANRNGLKFYTRKGELTKAEEAAIRSCLQNPEPTSAQPAGTLETDPLASDRFIKRYITAFGAGALSGWRIGLYEHSAVGRDTLFRLLSDLGAEVIRLGRSDTFIPVDTEAVDQDTRARIKDWVQSHELNALVSTDGDSDRPLLADETGQIIPGDILGQITAQTLGAQTVVTPISSNSGVTMKGFERVVRTAIGSPYVIAAMQNVTGKVVGYEANGGFLLGFAAPGPAGPIPPLVTRDSVLPLLITLHAAKDMPLSARVAQEPPVVTLSDRLQDIPQVKSRTFLSHLSKDAHARANFLALLEKTEAEIDVTDGLRITMQDATVVHIRPSGNAPELRLYVEAREALAARELMRLALARLDCAITGKANTGL